MVGDIERDLPLASTSMGVGLCLRRGLCLRLRLRWGLRLRLGLRRVRVLFLRCCLPCFLPTRLLHELWERLRAREGREDRRILRERLRRQGRGEQGEQLRACGEQEGRSLLAEWALMWGRPALMERWRTRGDARTLSERLRSPLGSAVGMASPTSGDGMSPSFPFANRCPALTPMRTFISSAFAIFPKIVGTGHPISAGIAPISARVLLGWLRCPFCCGPGGEDKSMPRVMPFLARISVEDGVCSWTLPSTEHLATISIIDRECWVAPSISEGMPGWRAASSVPCCVDSGECESRPAFEIDLQHSRSSVSFFPFATTFDLASDGGRGGADLEGCDAVRGIAQGSSPVSHQRKSKNPNRRLLDGSSLCAIMAGSLGNASYDGRLIPL